MGVWMKGRVWTVCPYPTFFLLLFFFLLNSLIPVEVQCENVQERSGAEKKKEKSPQPTHLSWSLQRRNNGFCLTLFDSPLSA